MNTKNKIKAIVAIAIAMVFIMPISAVANIDPIGISDSDTNSEIENIIDISSNIEEDPSEIANDEPVEDPSEIANDEPVEDPSEIANDEPVEDEPFIDELPVVIDDTIPVLSTGITVFVDDDANASWYDATHVRTFHEALANSTAGDTIYIHNGTYTETASYTQITKQLNIVGESRENVVLKGKTGYNKGFLYITSNNVNISTMTIKPTGTYPYQVIYSKGYNNLNFKDLNVDGVLKKYEGLYIRDCSNVNIINCDVYNCKDGIELYMCSYVDIINCNVYSNSAYGIYASMMYNPNNIIECNTYNNRLSGIGIKSGYYSVAPILIKNCTSYGNTAGSGILIDGQKDGLVTGCITYDNRYAGLYVANTDYFDFVNCVTYNNTQQGIRMGTGYNDPMYCNITDCTSYGNAEGIVLDAIAIILTGNAMYDNGGNLVIGGDPYQYVIDATNTVQGGKPVYWLIEVDDLVLDGSLNFGYLGLLGCDNITARDASPEGLVLSYTTNTTLTNITISGANTGFYIYAGANIKIDKCTSTGNGKYGFFIYYVDNVEITDCTATNMLVKGAFAFNIEGCPGAKITNCIAHDVGYSYGFRIKASPSTDIIDCQAYNGGPTYATGIYLYTSPYSNIINCTVHHFQTGISIYSSSTFINVIDCTVYDIRQNGFETRCPDGNYVNCTVNNTAGFFIYNNPRNNLTNCKSYDNRYGIVFYYAVENNLLNCEFYNNSEHGIDIHSSSHSNTFTNCKSYDNSVLWDPYNHPAGYGVIIVGGSYGTVFTNCDIYDNNYGFHIEDSPNTVMRDTIISGNNHSFEVVGLVLTDYYQDIDTSNTIDGDTIYYLVDEADMTIDETTDAGIAYLRLVSCDNMTLMNLDIPDMMLIHTTNSTLSNIKVHDNEQVYVRKGYGFRNKDGIKIWESSDNDVTGCDVYNSTGHGIFLQGSSDNSIVGCTIYDNNGHGIYLLNSPDNIIGNAGCTVTNNNYGIYLSASPNNKLRNNILTSNTIGFGVAGTLATDFYQDIDESNLIDGDPIYYLVGESDRVIDGSPTFGTFSYLILVGCDNMTVQNIDGGDLLVILTTNSTLDNIAAHHGVYGIYLWGSSYNDVIDCTAYNNTETGIYIRDSHYNDITRFTAYDNDELYNKGYGIYLSESSHNVITGCDSYSHNGGGIGVRLSGASYNDFINCDVYDNSNGFNLLAGTAGTTNNNFMLCDIYGNANYNFYARYANDNSITYCNLYDSKRSLHLDHVSGFLVDNCNIYGNSGEGIYATYFDYSTVSNCDIYGGGSYGIYLHYSDYSSIEKCDISGKSKGIYLYYSDRNDVEQCEIYANGYGIDFYYGCNYNTFWDNTIHSNTVYGMYLKRTSGTSYNKAYHNDFGNNNRHVYSYYSTNKWDNGYSDPYNATTDGGNYWDDYTGVDLFHGPSQNLTGPDGIGDTPYTIYGASTKDRYPLMNQSPPDIDPPVIDGVTLTTSDPLDTEPGFGWEKVTCTATDFALDEVVLVVTYPNASIVEYPMTTGSNTYSNETTLTVAGDYTYHVWADDDNDNNATSTPQTFLLPANWEMNDDRKCDISDLRKVALQFGETGTPGWIRADYNNDGKCDISDLRKVALNFGDTY